MANSITFNRGHKFAGRERVTPSGRVMYVEGAADIVYMKYTNDYKYTDRNYLVTSTKRRYRTLDAASAAVVKASGSKSSDVALMAALGPCGK